MCRYVCEGGCVRACARASVSNYCCVVHLPVVSCCGKTWHLAFLFCAVSPWVFVFAASTGKDVERVFDFEFVVCAKISDRGK